MFSSNLSALLRCACMLLPSSGAVALLNFWAAVACALQLLRLLLC
jgi:hypothetical protein